MSFTNKLRLNHLKRCTLATVLASSLAWVTQVQAVVDAQQAVEDQSSEIVGLADAI